MRYCSERSVDPFQAPINIVVEFLVEMFHKTGIKYSAINTARSAISSLLPSIGGVTIGNHPLIKRLMRGVFKERPALPKYVKTYDVDIVLRYLDKLGPARELPLARLTERLATLLCILSAQRDQTLQFIDVRNIIQTDSRCTIVIGDLTKSTRPGFHVKPLEFEKYENENICAMANIQTYMTRTFGKRGLFVQLLISMDTFQPVTASTIGRWVKKTLSNAGIDTEQFSAHSTRSASTSKAKVKGVSLKDICKAAGWSNAKTFAKHYRKPIEVCYSSTLLENQN